VGVAGEQSFADGVSHTARIAQHVIVPEADHAIPFGFDQPCSFSVVHRVMLTAVDLDNEPGAMADEIDDEPADRRLTPKARVAETLPQDSPHRSFRLGRVLPQSPGANRRSF
jgi:hypothetical protein